MRKQGIVARVFGLLLSINLFAGPTIGPTFNREAEFPNHFLPKNFSGLPPAQQKRVLAERRALLEKAIQSICERLVVPITVEGELNPKPVRYFEYINGVVSQIDSSAKVMPSGGVVRSILGYLYEQMHEQSLLNSSKDPSAVLAEVASDPKPIDAIEIRGVGGDFDVLIKSKQATFEPLKEKILEVTNSAEASLGARDDKTHAKRLLFTVGDVKSYDEQTKRSTGQGGSVIDYLAFDQGRGKFVEPEGHDYIVDEFLQGKYRYIAPTTNAEDFAKQAIRGIRPLLELPFLTLTDDTQLKKELREVLEQIKKGKIPSAKALEQVGKAIRNGRRSLANNRISRGARNSIEQAIFALSKELKEKKLPYFPEYVETNPLEVRSTLTKAEVTSKQRPELNGLPPELLTPIDDFIAHRTTDGKIFHGTPTLDNAMAIMRSGLFKSGGTYDQGGSLEGSAGYAGSSRETSFKYPEGLTIELGIKNDFRVNAIDFTRPEVSSHPFMKAASAKAEAMDMDLNDYLCKFHGIDLLYKGHAVLVTNMGALSLGNAKDRLVAVVHSMKSYFDSAKPSSREQLNALTEYLNITNYAKALGLPVTPPSQAALAEILSNFRVTSGSAELGMEDIPKLYKLFRIEHAGKPLQLAFRKFTEVAAENTAINAGSWWFRQKKNCFTDEFFANDPRIVAAALRGADGRGLAQSTLEGIIEAGDAHFRAHPFLRAQALEICERQGAVAALSLMMNRDYFTTRKEKNAFRNSAIIAMDRAKHEIQTNKIWRKELANDLMSLGYSDKFSKEFPEAYEKLLDTAASLNEDKRLSRIVWDRHEEFVNDPKALQAFIHLGKKYNLPETFTMIGYGCRDALDARPELLMEFIKISNKTKTASGLGHLGQWGPALLAKHPEALMEFIEAGKRSKIFWPLRNLSADGKQELKQNPEALVKLMEAPNPDIHENINELFKEDREFAERFLNDHLVGDSGAKAIEQAAKLGKIEFINEKIKTAGADIPESIKKLKTFRAANKALQRQAVGSSPSCATLLRLYLKYQKQ